MESQTSERNRKKKDCSFQQCKLFSIELFPEITIADRFTLTSYIRVKSSTVSLSNHSSRPTHAWIISEWDYKQGLKLEAVFTSDCDVVRVPHDWSVWRRVELEPIAMVSICRQCSFHWEKTLVLHKTIFQTIYICLCASLSASSYQIHQHFSALVIWTILRASAFKGIKLLH